MHGFTNRRSQDCVEQFVSILGIADAGKRGLLLSESFEKADDNAFACDGVPDAALLPVPPRAGVTGTATASRSGMSRAIVGAAIVALVVALVAVLLGSGQRAG